MPCWFTIIDWLKGQKFNEIRTYFDVIIFDKKTPPPCLSIKYKDRQADKQTNRQTDKQTGLVQFAKRTITIISIHIVTFFLIVAFLSQEKMIRFYTPISSYQLRIRKKWRSVRIKHIRNTSQPLMVIMLMVPFFLVLPIFHLIQMFTFSLFLFLFLKNFTLAFERFFRFLFAPWT